MRLTLVVISCLFELVLSQSNVLAKADEPYLPPALRSDMDGIGDPRNLRTNFNPTRMPPNVDPRKLPPNFDPTKSANFDPAKIPSDFNPNRHHRRERL